MHGLSQTWEDDRNQYQRAVIGVDKISEDKARRVLNLHLQTESLVERVLFNQTVNQAQGSRRHSAHQEGYREYHVLP